MENKQREATNDDHEPLHVCGENGALCRGKLSHETVMMLSELGTTPIKVAFGQGRYQGYKSTRDKYEKQLEVMDERLHYWRIRCKTAEGEVLRLQSEVFELERSLEVLEDPELMKRLNDARKEL